ncbi:conserved hypothetical protein [delta proteobacterium NaphS2]|nr:conserved hypothetical protein [delta proteobacterium NaphS2]
MKTQKIDKVLVTGAAGFIDYHLSKKLLDPETNRNYQRPPLRPCIFDEYQPL